MGTFSALKRYGNLSILCENTSINPESPLTAVFWVDSDSGEMEGTEAWLGLVGEFRAIEDPAASVEVKGDTLRLGQTGHGTHLHTGGIAIEDSTASIGVVEYGEGILAYNNGGCGEQKYKI